jgi:hypothetical protein
MQWFGAQRFKIFVVISTDGPDFEGFMIDAGLQPYHVAPHTRLFFAITEPYVELVYSFSNPIKRV